MLQIGESWCENIGYMKHSSLIAYQAEFGQLIGKS